VVATDTRISQGYNILSRVHSKSVKLTDKCILTTAGMVAEVESLHKNLMLKVRLYKMQNKREPTVESLA
jgi:20S proteasome subunit beta 6